MNDDINVRLLRLNDVCSDEGASNADKLVAIGGVLAARESVGDMAALLDARDTTSFSRPTPLMGAAANGLVDVVRLLLSKGADIMARNGYESTVMHWAAVCKQPDVIDAIVEYVVAHHKGTEGVEQLRALLEVEDDLQRTAGAVCQDYDTGLALKRARIRSGLEAAGDADEVWDEVAEDGTEESEVVAGGHDGEVTTTTEGDEGDAMER